jgi:hypothetical protein
VELIQIVHFQNIFGTARNKAHFSLTDFHIQEHAIFPFFSIEGTDENGHHSAARNLRNMAASQDTECSARIYDFLSLSRRNFRAARCVTTCERERRLLKSPYIKGYLHLKQHR